MKKAQIWVSAVLYIALGIVAISLILAAALPMIDKMRDRNTVVQTKGLLYDLDKSIRNVASEGPGSQRDLSPLEIRDGKLYINEGNENTIMWTMETKALILEPGVTINEGSISMLLEETNIEERYLITLELNYDNIAEIELGGNYKNPLSGKYNLVIKNTGKFVNELPNVAIIIN